jgi:hypothetical protein
MCLALLLHAVAALWCFAHDPYSTADVFTAALTLLLLLLLLMFCTHCTGLRVRRGVVVIENVV